MWFEVPLPYFLRNTLVGLGWSRPLTGLFLALWIIVYGQVRAQAHRNTGTSSACSACRIMFFSVLVTVMQHYTTS